VMDGLVFLLPPLRFCCCLLHNYNALISYLSTVSHSSLFKKESMMYRSTHLETLNWYYLLSGFPTIINLIVVFRVHDLTVVWFRL